MLNNPLLFTDPSGYTLSPQDFVRWALNNKSIVYGAIWSAGDISTLSQAEAMSIAYSNSHYMFNSGGGGERLIINGISIGLGEYLVSIPGLAGIYFGVNYGWQYNEDWYEFF